MLSKGHVLVYKGFLSEEKIVAYVSETLPRDRVRVVILHHKDDSDRGYCFTSGNRSFDEVYQKSNICPVCGKNLQKCANEVIEGGVV